MLTQLLTRIKPGKLSTAKTSPGVLGALSFSGVEFQSPQGWIPDDAGGGLLVVNPKIEKDWQAHLFFEERVASGAEFRTLEEAIEELIQEISKKKEKFQLISKRVESHAKGFLMGRVDYDCFYEGTALRESEIIFDSEASKRIYLMTSVARELEQAYQPVFEKVIASLIRPCDAPPVPPSVPSVTPTSSPETSSPTTTMEGVTFTPPSGWSHQSLGKTVSTLTSPQPVGGFTSLIQLEYLPYGSGQPPLPEVLIAERVAGLKRSLEGFQEIRRWAGPDAEGILVGLVEYTAVREKTPCTEFQMVFEFPKGHLWVRAAAATEQWKVDQPIFAAFVGSLVSTDLQAMVVRQFAGVSFVVPSGWSEAPHEGGFVLMDPDEGKGDGTIFIEKKEEPGSRAVEEIFEDYLPTLESGYVGFQQVQCRVGDHPGGFPFGFVEFTYTRDGAAYTQREFILDLGSNHRVYVLFSSKTEGWSSYLPLFDGFVYGITKG